MAQPRLDSVTLEYPTTWSITPVVGEAKAITLNGTLRTDVLYRKYIYELTYTTMSKTKYTALETNINMFIDNNTFPVFIYDKIPQASNGVKVLPRLSAAKRVSGAGQDYYVDVTLKLEEVKNKQV